jgi:two-component system LytT family sensor kinase
MEISQIIVLATLFALSFFGYWFFKRRFEKISPWVRYNLMFLTFGIVGAIVFTPFIYPYSLLKNLPVFTIIPFCAYNIFYIVNDIIVYKQIRKVAKAILEIFALISGAFIGVTFINILHIGVFNENDMATMLFIVFLFSIARILFQYSKLETIIGRSQAELKDSRIQELRTRQQLEILYSKINPHFLYNSLNSIAGLAMVDGKKTKDMTVALSKLLRYSLNYSESNFATLDEEAEIIQTYFDVEKNRFGEKLNYEIGLAEEAKDYLIPRFLLQPIVENCIKHAFKESESGNLINVNMSVSENEIVIAVHDNGKPFPDKLIPGYGFKNVNDKLQLLLPGKHDFQITNTPQKQVKIVIKELKKKG